MSSSAAFLLTLSKTLRSGEEQEQSEEQDELYLLLFLKGTNWDFKTFRTSLNLIISGLLISSDLTDSLIPDDWFVYLFCHLTEDKQNSV